MARLVRLDRFSVESVDLVRDGRTTLGLVGSRPRFAGGPDRAWVCVLSTLFLFTVLGILWNPDVSQAQGALDLTEEERAWIDENPRIRIHNEMDWPPFNFAVDNRPTGYSIDFMNLIAARAGLEVEYVTGPSWNEFLEMMRAGTLDVMLNIVKTPERQKYLLYTDPYADNPNTILSRTEDSYASLEELRGKTVSIPKGFFYEEVLSREFPDINLHLVKNTLDSIKAVSFGRADAAVGELAVFNHLLDAHLISDMFVSGEVKMGDPELSLLNIATRKDLPVLASILRKAVASVTEQEHQALREKWVPLHFEKGVDVVLVIQIGAAVGIVLLVFVIWNRQLRQEVVRRTQAERDLERARDQAAEAEALFKDAINNISDGFVLYDAQDRLVICNDRFRDLYKYAAEHVSEHPTWLELEEFDTKRNIIAWESAGEVPRGQRRWDDFQRELTDGRWIDIRQRRTTMGGLVCIHVDITDQKKAEEIMAEARDEAERLADAKSEFVAVISHEVRTPMNGVLGMAKLLVDTDLSPEQREFGETIVRSGESLLAILNDLLDLSKLEAGKVELESIPVDPRRFVDDTVAVMATRAKEKDLDLCCEVAESVPGAVYADPHRLSQILLNLLSNAIKFTAKGAVTVTLSAEERAAGGLHLCLSVKDSGVGIPPDRQAKLFSPYAQATVEIARKYGGTGLGLSICQRLAELMDGGLTLESTPGDGSCFTLRIPVEPASLEDVQEMRLVENLTAEGAVPVEPLQVLLVEDNRINQRVAMKMLEKQGHRFVLAEDGAEAVRLYEQQPFDVILMDRHMPEMNGIEATRRIRELEQDGTPISIVGVTAAANQREIADCLEAGMDEVIIKPIDPARLAMALAGIAPQHRQAPESGSALVLDPAVIDALRTDYGSDFIDTMIDDFRDLAGGLRICFAADLEESDREQLQMKAHSLKSNAKTLGLLVLSELCREVEIACIGGDFETASQVAATLPEAIDEALTALE